MAPVPVNLNQTPLLPSEVPQVPVGSLVEVAAAVLPVYVFPQVTTVAPEHWSFVGEAAEVVIQTLVNAILLLVVFPTLI